MSKRNESITGRDGYIVAQALYWAIKYSERLPDYLREWSNEQDMKAILSEHYSMFAEGFTFNDQAGGYETRKLIAAGNKQPEHDACLEHFVPPSLIDEKRSKKKPLTRAQRIEQGDAKISFLKSGIIQEDVA